MVQFVVLKLSPVFEDRLGEILQVVRVPETVGVWEVIGIFCVKV